MSTINTVTINANKASNVAFAASRAAGGGSPAGFVKVEYAEPVTLIGANSNDDIQSMVNTLPSGLGTITGSTVGTPDVIRFGKDSLIQGKFNTNGDLNTLTTFSEINTTGLQRDIYGRWLDGNGDQVTPSAIDLAFPVVAASGDLAIQDGDTYPGHINYRSPSETTKKILGPR